MKVINLMIVTLVFYFIVLWCSDFGSDDANWLEFDLLVFLIYEGNSFGLRVTPTTKVDKVFDFVCSKWKDLIPYTIYFLYVHDGKHHNIFIDSNLHIVVFMSISKR